MIIDCERCEVRGLACGSCAAPAIVASATVAQSIVAPSIAPPSVVTAWPDEEAQRGGPPPDLGPAELRALRTLANAGLIAPLRYAPRVARAS